MVLQNYVTLQDGIPAKMHFINHRIESRTITDPLSRQPKSVNTLVFDVDRLNDQVVSAKFSTMAEKLAGKFGPYLATKSYTGYDFTITQNGTGFIASYTVQVTPRSAGAQ